VPEQATDAKPERERYTRPVIEDLGPLAELTAGSGTNYLNDSGGYSGAFAGGS
jgi:hypothetical protein